jgi:SAM-dependent methyltransferase
MPAKHARPVGQSTRGKTALNRLRQIDIYVALTLSNILTGNAPLVVDLGFGAYPWTTLEMRERWLPINPTLRVLGVEIDPERVAAALPYAQPPTIDFQLGGFNLAETLKDERARLIRCYNVLRQYEEDAVTPALSEIAQALELGGVLIEGTSNPSGRLVAFDVYQKETVGLVHRSLVFGTNFRAPLEPVDFQTILPKRLIHHMRDDVPLTFFTHWQESFERTRGLGKRRQWVTAALMLKSKFGYPVDTRLRLLRRGYLGINTSLL